MSWSGTRRSFPTATRRRILARDPICRWREGCTQPATIADHIIPVAEGGSDDESNGQGLCAEHHDRKTRDEQARGRARRSTRRPERPHPGVKASDRNS